MTRKPRNKMSKKFDTLKPITIDQLGTKDNPCFGKHHSISAPECQRCGDAELCAIVVSQKNHIKRAEQEATKNFKDIEKTEVVNKKEIRKKIVERILELAKAAGKNGVPNKVVFDDIKGAYSKFGFSLKRLKLILNKTIERNSLTHKNDLIKWKK
jgi:hypothetical protein